MLQQFLLVLLLLGAVLQCTALLIHTDALSSFEVTPGLSSPLDVLVSPDGSFVYVGVSQGIMQYNRDGFTGSLTAVGLANGGAGDVVQRMTFGPNGRIYAVGWGRPDSVSMWNVGATGIPTMDQALTHDGITYFLEYASGVAVAPDGRHVYVAAIFSDKVQAFERNAVSGTMSPLPSGGTYAINSPYDVVVNPNNLHVYVVGDHYVARFRRDDVLGTLTEPADVYTPIGIGNPRGVAIHGTNNLYVCSWSSSLVHSFNVQGGGGLSFVRNDGNSTFHFRPTDIAISQNGNYVAVDANYGDEVALYERDPGTGTLTALYGTGPAAVLTNVHGVTFSPDSLSLYAVASGNVLKWNINGDFCVGSPCLNGGSCVNGLLSFSCNCVPGYAGSTCATNTNECSSAPCQNGGLCTDGISSFTCDCTGTGFTGSACTTNVDDCSPNPCQNGGACNDGINSFTCSCLPGYNGNVCQNDINECSASPCQNGGTCSNMINLYSCACVAGFTGAECQVNVNECASTPCQNGGLCIDDINSFTCDCAGTGFSGQLCSSGVDDCPTINPCLNGGLCVDGVNTFTCTCATGYTGPLCATNIDDCMGHQCTNNATCVDGVDTYTCSCLTGFTGWNCSTIVTNSPSTGFLDMTTIIIIAAGGTIVLGLIFAMVRRRRNLNKKADKMGRLHRRTGSSESETSSVASSDYSDSSSVFSDDSYGSSLSSGSSGSSLSSGSSGSSMSSGSDVGMSSVSSGSSGRSEQSMESYTSSSDV